MCYNLICCKINENKGVWCNGSIPVSKTVCEGSSPSTPVVLLQQKMRSTKKSRPHFLLFF